MGHIKWMMAGLLALALCLLFWRPARAPLKWLLRAMLWAACAMTASTGAVILWDSPGNPVALLGGTLLLGFSAYAALTAKAIGTK